jgi:hypothetical protein
MVSAGNAAPAVAATAVYGIDIVPEYEDPFVNVQLFGLMVVPAQLKLGGAETAVDNVHVNPPIFIAKLAVPTPEGVPDIE